MLAPPPRNPPRASIRSYMRMVLCATVILVTTPTTNGNVRDERGDLPLVVPVGSERRGRAPTEGPPPVRRGRLDPDGPARVPCVGGDDAVHHSRTESRKRRSRWRYEAGDRRASGYHLPRVRSLRRRASSVRPGGGLDSPNLL